MSDRFAQLPRRRIWSLPDAWTIGAVLIAAVVLAPILSIAWIALNPTENIWPHLIATVLPRYLGTTLLLMAGVAGLSAAIAFALLLGRDPGEVFLLGLSPDMRFVLALILGTLAGALGGVSIETALIRPFYGAPVTQLVLTLGLSIAGIDLIEAVWGEEANPPMPPPSLFSAGCRSDSFVSWFTEHCQSIDVLGRAFPTLSLIHISEPTRPY